jgi:hypothetical protein
MPTPSLILVPARFKTGKLYTPVATTSGGLVLGASGDFNVTRATTATRVNASGLIEVVASGIPRLDYYTSGGTAGCPALLVEASGSNVALRSAGLDVSGTWQRSNISVTTGITSPEGLTTAFNIVESSDGSAQTHELAQTGFSVVSGTAYTFSLFIKAGTNNRNLRLAVGGANFVGSPVAIFNPVSGTVVASGDCVPSVENYGNGWFRCRITATADVAGTSFLGIYTASGTSVSYIGNGSGSVQVWGAQAEASSIATSYIPTTAAAVTRNADVISLSGAVSGCIGQTEGTIYAEVDIQFNNRNADIIGLDSGSSANGFYLVIRSSSVIELRIRQNSTNALIFQRTGAYPVGINKIAVSYKNGDFAISLNGTTTQVDTTTITMPSVAITRASVVPSINFTLDQSVRVRPVTLYTTRLTNTELAALTTL